MLYQEKISLTVEDLEVPCSSHHLLEDGLENSGLETGDLVVVQGYLSIGIITYESSYYNLKKNIRKKNKLKNPNRRMHQLKCCRF